MLKVQQRYIFYFIDTLVILSFVKPQTTFRKDTVSKYWTGSRTSTEAVIVPEYPCLLHIVSFCLQRGNQQRSLSVFQESKPRNELL